MGSTKIKHFVIKNRIEDIFDLRTMVVDALVRDKALMNKMFLEVGHAEFKFIERSGFYFGFLFGMFQAVIWAFSTVLFMQPGSSCHV